MKKWLIATAILILIALGIIFIAGNITGNVVYNYEQPSDHQQFNDKYQGNHQAQVKESCDKLDCKKREIQVCKLEF